MKSLILAFVFLSGVLANAAPAYTGKGKLILALECETETAADRPLKMDVFLVNDGTVVTQWIIKDMMGNQLEDSMDYAGNLDIRSGVPYFWTGSEQSSDIEVRLNEKSEYEATIWYLKEVIGSDDPPVPYELTCKK